MKTKLTFLLISLTAPLLLAGPEQDIRLQDCPPAVRATFESNARNGKISEVDFIEIESKRIYIAEVDLRPDIDLKIYVDGNGGLIKTREEVLPKDRPAFVETLVSGTGGRLDDLEKETTNGVVTYHLEVDRNGAPDLRIVASADGKVIRQTEEVED